MPAALLIAVGAQVEVPMLPVPMTLQSLALVVVAGRLGLRRGVAAVGLYLVLGAIGLPVFAGGAGGWSHLVGKTAGYLVGFIACAAWVGWRLEAGNPSFWRRSGEMMIGHVIVLSLGALWLASHIGLERAVTVGAAPFLLGAVVKSLVGAGLTSNRR